MKPTTRPPVPAPRGEPLRDFCEREAISRRTAWRWIEKGVLKVSRIGPATGIRVQYRGEEPQT